MKTTLSISATLSLPLELAARTVAILAQKGSGKTYTAMRITEELLLHGQQVVALDPTGVWWGLRASDDAGKTAGFPVIVLGGEHADAPLEPTAGKIVAEFAVESGRSLVFDMSGFESNAAQDRFATDFAVSLYRLKATNRATLHVMVDEADSFAPQRPMPGQQTMLGAFEAIVRRGRSRGIGITMISQRPAVLNKNVLSQADLLIAGRVVGIHDHKALDEWASLYGTQAQLEKFGSSLPQLETGEAWFWSPSWLGIFQRARISKRLTFDSSRTPSPGEKRVIPAMRTVDLAGLSKDIAASVERAKANDPAALKRRIAELESQVSKKPAPEKERIEVPVLDKKVVDRIEKVAGRIAPLLEELSRELSIANAAIRRAQSPAPTQQTQAVKPIPRPQTPRPTQPAASNGTVPSGGLRRMMVALAQRPGLNKRQLGVRAILSSGSGTFGTYLGRMRAEGWLDGSSDSMQLTENGVAALGTYDPLPTGAELLDYWLRDLGNSGAARMLRALADAAPRAISKAELGALANLEPGSGTFGTYLGKLRALELVEGKSELSISPDLQ